MAFEMMFLFLSWI